MANNRIQVKRTSTAGRQPNTTNSSNSQYIAAGEFALNMTDQILYTSDGTNLITVGSNTVNHNVTGTLTANVVNVNGLETHANAVLINNNQQFRFQTVNTSAYAYFIQQNDDNFVMYTTNSSYGSRAVWSVYSNSSTSNVNYNARTYHSGGIMIPSGATFLDSTGSQGTAGQILASNGAGNVYWVTPGAASVNTAAQFTWTNTQTFSTNTIFNSNLTVNTSAAIIANGTPGTSGQVLTSNGSTVYWSTVSGGGGSINTAATYAFTNTTASGNATSGAITTAGGLGVANNIYVGGRVGFSNGSNISVVYQYYNATTGSLDTVFG